MDLGRHFSADPNFDCFCKFYNCFLAPEHKIDDEYIHRYLGALGPTEENALIQVNITGTMSILIKYRTMVTLTIITGIAYSVFNEIQLN